MIVKTWNNGSFNPTGSGYGVRIPVESRQKYFNRSWEYVILIIDDKSVEIKLRDTFWTTCSELRSKVIGEFLINNNLGSWKNRCPHELYLELVKSNIFVLRKSNSYNPNV